MNAMSLARDAARSGAANLRLQNVVLGLVLLPIIYVDNPIIRLAPFDDTSPCSYGSVAILTALACGVAVFDMATGRLYRPDRGISGDVGDWTAPLHT